MTIREELETTEPESAAEVMPSYVIDPARVAELNRSLATILYSRRCASCKARLEASGAAPSAQEHMKEISKCCATQDGFIRPEMPMQEIMFRTILSGGNRPVSLERLHYAVTDTWYTPINPRNISASSLRQVLDSDDYYGFSAVEVNPTDR